MGWASWSTRVLRTQGSPYTVGFNNESTAIANNADRAVGYGMPGASVDNNDALEVYSVVGEAISRARAGEGPSLIECKTDNMIDFIGAEPIVFQTRIHS